MKTLFTLLLLWNLNPSKLPNKTVEKVDVRDYAGTWYSLYSIPTPYDKGSRETKGDYTWNASGNYFEVVTSYKKPGSEEVHTIESKIFQVPGTNNAQMKCQFVWPFKLDYWVIELAPDYSYVVVGHPERKLLFIMSRNKSIDKKTYSEIVARCEARGYDISKLTSQRHQSLPGVMNAKSNQVSSQSEK
jgi:apolipoprotein D and lipocalin family protein